MPHGPPPLIVSVPVLGAVVSDVAGEVLPSSAASARMIKGRYNVVPFS
jgi:hypothetical protein